MRWIAAWPAMAVLVGLATACSDSNSDDSPGKLSGPTGSAGSKGGRSDASSSGPSDGSSTANDAADAEPACPKGAYRYDGGDCKCLNAVPNVCPGADGGPKEVCVNVMTDPLNCGGCGMPCDPSVGCNGGKCGAKAMQFATAGAGCGSLKITYSNGKLYWADKGHGVISSMATTAGTPAPLAMSETSPFDIVVSTGNVYWIDGGNQTVRKVKDSGGTVSTLVTGAASAAGPGTIHAIAVSADGNALYYAQDTCIYTVSTTGPTATKACTPLPGNGTACATIAASACVGSSEWGSNGIPSALAVDAQNVYYPTDKSGNIEIMSLATGLEFKVARSQGGLLFDTIYVNGGHLYWANDATVVENSAFVIGPDAGIGGDIVGEIQGSSVTAFAVGPTRIYYAEDGIVDKSPPTNGGTVVTYVLARNVPVLETDDAGTHQPMPNSIALDGTNVYWTTGDCKIMVLADAPQ